MAVVDRSADENRALLMKALEARALKQAERRASPLRQDFEDAGLWVDLASARGYRLPRWGDPPTPVAMQRELKKLGVSVDEYLKWDGLSTLRQFAALNPDWPLRAWAGRLLLGLRDGTLGVGLAAYGPELAVGQTLVVHRGPKVFRSQTSPTPTCDQVALCFIEAVDETTLVAKVTSSRGCLRSQCQQEGLHKPDTHGTPLGTRLQVQRSQVQGHRPREAMRTRWTAWYEAVEVIQEVPRSTAA